MIDTKGVGETMRCAILTASTLLLFASGCDSAADSVPDVSGRHDGGPSADAGEDAADAAIDASQDAKTDVGQDALDDGPIGEAGEAGAPVIEVRDDGFYRDGERFLPLIGWELPAGVTESEALAAGFDVLAGPGDEGLRAIAVTATGSEISSFVAPYADMPNLLGWAGPDEALWNGIDIATLQSEFVAPLRAADPTRALLLNHAPRGSQTDPLDFDQLVPYVNLGDVALMDIYPVPEGNGHSALVDHPGLSAVGAHADILRNLIEGTGAPRPFVMIVLGAGLGRIPSERWELLENWVQDTSVSASNLRALAVCDMDGDQHDEAVVALAGSAPALAVYDFDASPFGERSSTVALPADLDADGIAQMVCGDFSGDGSADVVMLVEGGATRQDIWGADSSGSALLPPTLRQRSLAQDFAISAVRHAVETDFDGDGCDDLVISYDYPNDDQYLFGIRSDCQGIVSATLANVTVLHATTSASFDLEHWRHVGADDLDGDGLGDLVFGAGDGTSSQVVWLRSTGTSLSSPASIVDVSSSELDLSGGRVAVGGLTSASTLSLVSLRGGSLRAADLDVSAMPSSVNPSLWYGAGTLDEASVLSMGSGDIDGDGRADVVLAESMLGGGMRLRLGVSTGSYFGARDPMAQEMRFMAFNALSHGSAGLTFWCQQFASKQDPVWKRLTDTARELTAIVPHLSGTTISRGTLAHRGWWWVEDGSGWVLVEQNESRTADMAGTDRALPAGASGTVRVWRPALHTFEVQPNVSVVQSAVRDTEGFGPYETRIYRVEP